MTPPLLELLNRLLADALADAFAGAAPRGGIRPREVVLDAEGARIVAALEPPAGEGALVLRLCAEPPRGGQQALTLTVEQPPARWAPAAEPFRRVLEGARLRLDLDAAEPEAPKTEAPAPGVTAPAATATGGPLLALLQGLLRTALAAQDGPGAKGGNVRLADAEPLPDGARLHLRVQGLGGLLDTTVRLRLTLREVGAASTRCTLALDDADRGGGSGRPMAGGLGRLLGAGMSGLPRPVLEQVLARVAGDAVRLEPPATDDPDPQAPGEMPLVLDHAALLKRLRG